MSTLSKFKFLLVLILFSLSACSSNNEEIVWQESEPFIKDNLTLYGTEGEFGITKVNGEEDEPAFPVGQGRHYYVYLLDDSADFNGKKYTMTATHKETDETVQLYEWGIDNNQSGAKFALDKEGLWKIDVSVDDEHLTSFVVRAEEK
ncbi:hypothetical protein [Bacillus sp. SG-1]|uniref:hypothetical protein n=1 Tax=Bacillus sp. SG-1 TaxID=161544 RepID=UPI0001543F28|nr:hypothetical protein [Bacillus sp. SG-1]EDL66405.1 topology modulation protein [Bacillus sp. SG-1]